jgi:hypothetical protein
MLAGIKQEARSANGGHSRQMRGFESKGNKPELYAEGEVLYTARGVPPLQELPASTRGFRTPE